MKRAAVQFGVALALLVILGNTRAMAQTPVPPAEPNDFTASFAGFDYYALPSSTTQSLVSFDGGGFSNFGFWFPGIPGTITGDMFEDYTNKRERFDVGSTDPKSAAPLATIWKFYERSKTYIYNPATGKCTNSSLAGTLHPFFESLPDSSFEGQTGFAGNVWYGYAEAGNEIQLPGNIWTYQLSARNSLEFGTDTSPYQKPLYVTRYAPGRITRLQFMSFTLRARQKRTLCLYRIRRILTEVLVSACCDYAKSLACR